LHLIAIQLTADNERYGNHNYAEKIHRQNRRPLFGLIGGHLYRSGRAGLGQDSRADL
jgi:hypothetical protein